MRVFFESKYIFVLFMFSEAAFGFTLNSSFNPDMRGWPSTEVQFVVNTANCPAGFDVQAVIETAVKVWNNIPTSNLKVSYGGATTSTTFSSPPTVYCETNFQSVTGADQNSVPGAGAVLSSGGVQISGGLLILNASAGRANIGTYDSTVLSIIMAHEIGHILGLGHSEKSASLMYFDASARRTLSLGQDDIDGMSYLYPRDELGRDKMMGCGLISGGANRVPPQPMPPTGLLLLAAFFALPLGLNFFLRNLRQPHKSLLG